jgi:peptidyl-prolyl cis-trans isomerase C
MKFALVLAVLAVAVPAFATDLAKVNGTTLTDKDLVGALGGYNDAQRENVLRDKNTRRQVLNSLIDQELLVQEAQKEDLAGDDEYKSALEHFRKQWLVNRLLAKNLSNKLGDKEVHKFYENHKLDYSTDQVHALHILVNDEEAAKDILKKMQGKDDDAFQALAEKMSKDPSAKNNRGDLGTFGRGRMVREFTDAAFSAKEGETVGPIKTSYGYHVIRVISHKVGSPVAFEEIEPRVRNDLRQEIVQNYVGKLKAQAKVEVEDKAVDKN